MQHVLILDLHDTCDLCNLVLGHGIKSLKLKDNPHHFDLYDEFFRHGEHLCENMTFCVPKFALCDPLIIGTHGERLVKHEYFFEHCMRHGVLKFSDKRDKFKFLVHGLRISLLVFNPHWIDMAMEFVLKDPRSKREKHFHLVLFGSFLVLVYDPGRWICKHINNKRISFLRNSSMLRSRILFSLNLILVFSFDVGKEDFNLRLNTLKE